MSRPMRLVLLWLMLGSCAPRVWDDLPRESLLRGAAGDDVDAVTLLDQTRLTFLVDGSTGRAAVDEHRTLRKLVLKPGPEAQLAPRVSYVAGFERVVFLRARVVYPSGVQDELDEADRVDAPELSDNALYDESRVARLRERTVPPGVVVETQSLVRHFEPRLFQFEYAFGGSTPERDSRLVVTVPEGWEIEWRVAGPEPLREQVSRVDGRTRYVWERRDLPPVKVERAGPLEEALPRVQLRLLRWVERGEPAQGFKDARELSRWVYRLSQGTTGLSPALEKTVDALVAEAGPEPEARAKRLHRFVCDEVQYCAIQVGYGAWKPHDAAEVFRYRSGDCKDKANLERAMLARAGISSRLAMVCAHHGWPRPFGLPTVAGNFNHMVLLVDLPQRAVLVDPTQREVPFGELPPSIAEADLLPVTAEGSALERTPAILPEQNRTQVSVALSPERDGYAGSFELSAQGAAASALRSTVLTTTDEERRRLLPSLLGMPGARVRTLTLRGERRGERALWVHGTLGLGPVVQGQGSVRLFRLSEVLASALEPLPPGPRRLPYVQAARGIWSTRLELALPEGVQALEAPADEKLESRFGTFSLRYRSAGGKLVADREWVVKERVVLPADYPSLREYHDAIHRAEVKSLVLRASDRPPP